MALSAKVGTLLWEGAVGTGGEAGVVEQVGLVGAIEGANRTVGS